MKSKKLKTEPKDVETESKEISEKELSDNDKARIVFKDNEAAYKKYLYVRKFSTLKHEQAVAHIKRLFKIND